MAEWISVKDRLPEKNGRYLCCLKSLRKTKTQVILGFALNLEEFDDLFFRGKKYSGFFEEQEFYEVNCVTHWMPLPEPPKGE